MNKVVEKFNSLLNISFLMVALDVIVGMILLMYTELASNITMVIIGCLLVVHGLFSFINYFYDGLGNNFFKVELIGGIVSLLLGILVILNPVPAINILGIGMGLWLIANGCLNLTYSVKFLNAKEEIASLVMFVSIIAIVMGIFTIFNPFSRFMLLGKLIGIFTIANGVFNAVRIVLYKKRAKNILKLFD